MKKLLCLLGLLALTACGTTGQAPTAVKVGKPYNIAGQTYVPEQDDGYDEEGIASWYGPGFHGGRTANGERFDADELTAAHPTLPMPSLVKVTNLKNGKEVVVRINDRGPFAKGRIIDLSRAAAKEIGVHGIDRVRVQYLKEETEQYWAENKLKTNEIRFSKNSPIAKPDMDAVQEASNEASAPILSVASSDIAPASKQAAIKPRARPKFSLVSEAQAAERPIENSNLNQDVPDEDVSDSREDDRDSSLKPLVDEVAPKKYIPSNAPKPAKKQSSDGGRYFVQVGAFANEENATRLSDKITSLGEVNIAPMQGASGTLYRVRMGPKPSRSEAQSIVESLKGFGIKDAKIVTE